LAGAAPTRLHFQWGEVVSAAEAGDAILVDTIDSVLEVDIAPLRSPLSPKSSGLME
jgi:hypothetical protein